METSKDISVIVCSFNHDKWIDRCISSIINQKFLDKNSLEIIIVNDGSKDNTKKVLEKYKIYSFIKIVNNKKNIGLSKSLNIAIKKSLGRYVVRVDFDDYLARISLFFMKKFLDLNRAYSAVSVDYIEVDEYENVLKRKNSKDKLIACGVMFRREVLYTLGLYNERFKMREGHELYKKFITKKLKMGYLEMPFYKYRMHKKNRTKNLKEVKKYNRLLKQT